MLFLVASAGSRPPKNRRFRSTAATRPSRRCRSHCFLKIPTRRGRIFGNRIQSNDYFEVIVVTDYCRQKVLVTKYPDPVCRPDSSRLLVLVQLLVLFTSAPAVAHGNSYVTRHWHYRGPWLSPVHRRLTAPPSTAWSTRFELAQQDASGCH